MSLQTGRVNIARGDEANADNTVIDTNSPQFLFIHGIVSTFFHADVSVLHAGQGRGNVLSSRFADPGNDLP